ncbi:MAG: aminoacyl-tRNA hydrolase [bacterium]
MDEDYLLVGLGNPGSRYEHTRHNLGFMIVEKISRDLNCPYSYKNEIYGVAKSKVDTKNVILAKPLTYMNRSGVVVSKLVDKYKIPFRNLLIILDDFNLPFGKLRLRSRGSDGGHNGLASIIQEISSLTFPRLRVGIGQENIEDSVDFVLSNFDENEVKMLPQIIQRASEASLNFVVKGITKTMSTFN